MLFDTAPSAEGKRMVVDKETKESVFYVQLSGAKGDLDYTEPYISSDPPICSPRVSGVMRKVGQTGDHALNGTGTLLSFEIGFHRDRSFEDWD